MIPITRPCVGQEEALAAAEVVTSGWLTQGRKVEEFEEAVARYVGSREAVATTNCTSALHLALLAAGVGPGDEVICPSFSFIATANAIVHAGARPVFVDIDPKTYTIDPEQIEVRTTSHTKAIMPVDQIGLAADLGTVISVAHEHGLSVVEDAAPALGATFGEARVGSLSDFTCFSFHPRKSITTGEGGMITTNDQQAAARIRRLRSHAASTSDLTRHRSASSQFEQYDELGYNYRLSDIHAAVGIVQMRRLDQILAKRKRLAERYNDLLREEERLDAPFEPLGRSHTYQSYCVRLSSSLRRDAVMAALDGRGVATRRGVMAIHLEPYYRFLCPYGLPETEKAAEETMLLPLYADMTDAEQDHVVGALQAVLHDQA